MGRQEKLSILANEIRASELIDPMPSSPRTEYARMESAKMDQQGGDVGTMREAGERLANVKLACKIISSYVANNVVPRRDLTALIQDVHSSLGSLKAESSRQNLKPAVPVEESVGHDYLTCLEDGKRVKLLARYLKATYNLTPAEYRRRWQLPDDYPMVAPAYSEIRSQIAAQSGFGARLRAAKEALELHEAQ